MAEGTPGLSPPWAVTTSPLPPTAPPPSRALSLTPALSGPHPSAAALGEEEEAHHGAGKPRAELESERSQEKQWSWKTHQRGHRRNEPPRPAGTEPPWAGDTLCPSKCSAKPRLWGPGRAAPVIRKCKRRNTTEKAKTQFGFNPSPMGDTVPAWKASSPCFWSKDVTLGTQELWEGLWEPPCSWAPPAISLASVCIYIFIHIYLYLSLSLSCSPRNRGRANSQARGPDGSSCLQGAGAPQGSLTHCPGLHKCFFPSLYFTAVP